MTRQLRQFAIGRIYHVLNRGVERRKIFLKEQDYSRFTMALEFFNDQETILLWNVIASVDSSDKIQERLIARRSSRSKPLVELLAFALMPNHYHLIIREITHGGISSFMKKMGGYSTYFNKQYNRVGSLFQSRYKAVLVKTDTQLSNVFTYVHTNPVELWEPGWKDLEVQDFRSANEKLLQYRWSSYFDYIGTKNFPEVTTRDFFLEFFGSSKECRQAVEDWVRFKAGEVELGDEIIEA